MWHHQCVCIGAGDSEATSYIMQPTVQSSVQVIGTSALLCTGAVSEATLDTVRQTVQYSVQVFHSYVLSRRYKLYNTLHRAVDAALCSHEFTFE